MIQKNFKKLILLSALSVIPLAMLSAQSASAITTLLEQEDLALGWGIYLTQVGSGVVGDEEARVIFDRTDLSQFSLAGRSFDDPVTLGEFCYVVMKTLEIPGGLFYSIFPGARYAIREMQYRKLLVGISGAHQFRKISGAEAVQIFADALFWKTSRIAAENVQDEGEAVEQ